MEDPKFLGNIHPGAALAILLEKNNVSLGQFSEQVHIPIETIIKITNEEIGLTVRQVFIFSTFFKTTCEFWINLELKFFEDIAFKEHLEWASKVVNTWPEWKRNLLYRS